MSHRNWFAGTIIALLLSAIGLLTVAYAQDDIPPETVVKISWSHDGSRFAAGQIDGTITIWDAQGEQSLLTLIGHTALVTSLVWSPDDTQLISTSYDYTARIWDIATGETRHVLRDEDLLLSALWLQPTRILTGAALTGPPPGFESLKEWDIRGEEAVIVRSIDAGTVTRLALSPDGKYIAVGSAGGYVSVHALDNLELLWLSWERPSSEDEALLGNRLGDYVPVGQITWHPDGYTLASSNALDGVRVRNAETGEVIAEYKASDKPRRSGSRFVLDLTFAQNGSQLQTVVSDGTARLWDVAARRVLETVEIDDSLAAAASSPGKDRIAFSLLRVEEVDERTGFKQTLSASERVALSRVYSVVPFP